MILILVRHGETDWNEGWRYQGRSDVPLNDTGQQQAQQVASRLASREITAIFSSPLSRAWKTAQAIAEPHGLSVQIDPDLREMDFGTWEGKTHAEIDAVDSERLAAWWEDPVHQAPPGGESLRAVGTRVGVCRDRLRAAYREDETIVVVSHVGPIKALLFEALQWDLGGHWQVRIDRASLTTLHYTSPGAILMGCNDTGHRTPTDA